MEESQSPVATHYEHPAIGPERRVGAGSRAIRPISPAPPAEMVPSETLPGRNADLVARELIGEAVGALSDQTRRLLTALLTPGTTLASLSEPALDHPQLALALERYAALVVRRGGSGTEPTPAGRGAGSAAADRRALVARTMARLGTQGLRQMVYLCMLAETLTISPELDLGQRRRLWFHALDSGALSAQLARSADEEAVDLAYAAGLLHDLGHIALLRCRPGLLLEIGARARALSRPLREVEKARLGVDHAELGAWLAAEWGLPPEICGAIQSCHAGSLVGEWRAAARSSVPRLGAGAPTCPGGFPLPPGSPEMTGVSSFVATAGQMLAGAREAQPGRQPLDASSPPLAAIEEVDRLWARLFDLPYRFEGEEIAAAEIDPFGALARQEAGRLYLLADDGRVWERSIRFDGEWLPDTTPYRLVGRRGMDIWVAQVLDCPLESAGEVLPEALPRLLKDLRVLRFALANRYVGSVHRLLPPPSHDRTGSPRTDDPALFFDPNRGAFVLDAARYAQYRGRPLAPVPKEASLPLLHPVRIQIRT